MSELTQVDQLKFSRLKIKKTEARYFKIVFYKEGLVEDAKHVENDHDHKHDKNCEIWTWYLKCVDNKQRNHSMI